MSSSTKQSNKKTNLKEGGKGAKKKSSIARYKGKTDRGSASEKMLSVAHGKPHISVDSSGNKNMRLSGKAGTTAASTKTQSTTRASRKSVSNARSGSKASQASVTVKGGGAIGVNGEKNINKTLPLPLLRNKSNAARSVKSASSNNSKRGSVTRKKTSVASGSVRAKSGAKTKTQ
uniref:Uncharacterized protein n=1 Tax=Lygus hesperus TaxID=30085 RepID=A0A0A9Z7L9_LYGHE